MNIFKMVLMMMTTTAIASDLFSGMRMVQMDHLWTVEWETTMFLSFMMPFHDSILIVDENYGPHGSSLYQISRDGGIEYQWSGEGRLGAVFLLIEMDEFLLPCIGSDEIWRIDRNTDVSSIISLEGRCHRPHAIYRDMDRYFIPCVGSDIIMVMDSSFAWSFSIEVVAPRHMLFIDSSFYVITETSAQILRWEDGVLMGRMEIPSSAAGSTGAEILRDGKSILVSLRVPDQPGCIYRYDLHLNMIGRPISVGRMPRYMAINEKEGKRMLYVCNQESMDVTIIHLDIWSIHSTFVLPFQPQCCCFV